MEWHCYFQFKTNKGREGHLKFTLNISRSVEVTLVTKISLSYVFWKKYHNNLCVLVKRNHKWTHVVGGGGAVGGVKPRKFADSWTVKWPQQKVGTGSSGSSVQCNTLMLFASFKPSFIIYQKTPAPSLSAAVNRELCLLVKKKLPAGSGECNPLIFNAGGSFDSEFDVSRLLSFSYLRRIYSVGFVSNFYQLFDTYGFNFKHAHQLFPRLA